jgi:hypothetical protein
MTEPDADRQSIPMIEPPERRGLASSWPDQAHPPVGRGDAIALVGGRLDQARGKTDPCEAAKLTRTRSSWSFASRFAQALIEEAESRGYGMP